MRAVADHRQQVHIVWLIVSQVGDWSKGGLSFFSSDEQSHRAVAEEHRLNDESGIQPLLFEVLAIELLLFAPSNEFTITRVLIPQQWCDVRCVRFCHHNDRQLSWIRCEVPLRHLYRLQQHRTTLSLHADGPQRARE